MVLLVYVGKIVTQATTDAEVCRYFLFLSEPNNTQTTCTVFLEIISIDQHFQYGD